MSVINKMLRDLDSRKAEGSVSTRNSALHSDVGTRSVQGSTAVGRKWDTSKKRIWIIAAVIVVVGVGAMAWFLKPLTDARPVVVQAVAVSTTNAAAPVAAVIPVQKEIDPVIAASATVKPTKVRTQIPAKLPAPPVFYAPVVTSLKMDNLLKKVPVLAAERDTKSATAVVPDPERQLVEPSQKLALNALAQAQSLWNSGSHSAAIDLLREALGVAERTGKPSGGNTEMAPLARELARMELAEGRTSQALMMLSRLEPFLSGFADVWAIRGNAAQRLGRHEESASAYLTALKLRPDEPRWMLGAAVSLAAQGQIASATELTEKARAAGVLSPDVAAYLRQLGVTVRER